MSRLFQLRGSPLAFPGGEPGFDPTHPAAPGTLLSIVASNGGLIRLDKAQVGAVVGSPTANIDSGIGPCVKFSGSGDAINFSGFPTTAFLGCTIAAIVTLTALPTSGNSQYIFVGSSTAAGLLLNTVNTAGVTQFCSRISGATEIPWGPSLAINTPYFVAVYGAPNNGSGSGFSGGVVVNLATGQIYSGSNSGGGNAATGGNGTAQIGNRAAATAGNCKISAVMFSQFIAGVPASSPGFQVIPPLTRLLQWAADPWSFWYPRRARRVFHIITGSGQAYNATTTVGSYAITGASPLLKRSTHLISAIGSYAITGFSPLMLKSKILATAIGSYAITGASPLLQRSTHLISAIGSYAITGVSPLLKRSTHLISAIGSYAITGFSPLMQKSKILATAIGSYAVTGLSPLLQRSAHLISAPGSYAISGVSPLLLKAVKTSVSAVQTGVTAAILYSARTVQSALYKMRSIYPTLDD